MVASVYYPWVDRVKTLGIFLVILGHGGLVNDGIGQFVYSFHMPLFFMVSGMLYKPVPFSAAIRKYFFRLIVPYLLINAVCLSVVVSAAVGNGSLSWDFVWRRVGAVCMGLGYEAGKWVPVDGPTWFLVALFYVYAVVSAGYGKRFYPAAVALLSIPAAAVVSAAGCDTYTPADSALLALPFFCGGYYMKDILCRNRPLRVNMGVCAVCLAATLAVSIVNGRVDMNTFDYGRNLGLFFVGAEACVSYRYAG